jgi:hypothetical protein
MEDGRFPFPVVMVLFFGSLYATSGFLGGDVGNICCGLTLVIPCVFVLLSKQKSGLQHTLAPGSSALPPAYSGASMPVQMSGRGSRLDRYESVMFRLRLAPSEGQTVASLMAQHKRWFNGGEKAARAFFNHPQVIKALDLGGANSTASAQTMVFPSTNNQRTLTSDLRNDSFWGGLEQKAAKSVPSADGVCGMVHCSNEVNAFSFQCFQCRRRICNSCGNTGVLCRTCAS